MKKEYFVFLQVVLFCAGCSMQQMALKQTAGLLKKAVPAFEKEEDFELASVALPANVKVVEGFLQAGPKNEDLLELAAVSYASYALVVLEDQFEQAEDLSPKADALGLRARQMYLRAHDFGLRLLEVRNPGFTEAFKKGRGDLHEALRKLDKNDVPGLFWSGMPLFTAINLARDNVNMIVKLPKARALIERVLELDEKYYHAGGHMLRGGMLGSVGKMLGGDPVAAKKHFERALELTKRRFLLVQVMYAKTLAVQMQDKELFTGLLNEVVKANLSISPEQKLANVAAKRRARRLLAKTEELF
ncbi:MAG: TRAP transporter TatT component family protein [Pseudomonadota bacterium]